MGIDELLNEVRRRLSVNELTYVAASLSHYHRIQGSKGLVEAAGFIKDILEDHNLEVEVLDFSYLRPPKWLSTLVGWWVKEAELTVVSPEKVFIESYPELPTSVVAHSPGGEFEDEVMLVDPESLPESLNGVVITKWVDSSYYIDLCERGAKAVLFYREDAPRDAVPYLGIFPSVDDAGKVKAPALSISISTVSLIKSLMRKGRVKVRGHVKSGFTDPYACRVVSAVIGKGREVHMVAHYCHPAGTVNDNVSGSASLAVVACALGMLGKDLGQALEGSSLRFLWVPEYFGSLSLLERLESEGRLSNIAGCVNLDMIGERQSITGSTLLMIRSPIHMMSELEALTYLSIRGYIARKFSVRSRSYTKVRFRAVNFGSGSDHESYISFGIPAVAFINWPDRYYHSSMDTIDKLDPGLALSTTLAGLKAAVTCLKADRSFTDRVMDGYRNAMLGEDILDVVNDDLLAELRRKLYVEGLNPFKVDEEVMRVKGKGVPSLRLIIKKVTKEEAEIIRNARNRMPWIREALTLTPILASKGLGLEGIRNALQAELGVRISESQVNLIISALTSIGALE